MQTQDKPQPGAGGQRPAARKAVQKLRGAHLPVQIRVREQHEPDLFAFLKQLPAGMVSAFLRSALLQALRCGALSAQGFAWTADQAVRQLQGELQLASEENQRLLQRIEELERNIPPAPVGYQVPDTLLKAPSPAPAAGPIDLRERKLAAGLARALQLPLALPA